jgi:DNA invertase Pin-like site-specific DNA recombinase
MNSRVVTYISGHSCSPGTSGEPLDCLSRAVEGRGDVVVGTFSEAGAEGRGKSAWKALLTGLDGVDQVAVTSAGDLPGRTVADLLRLLETLRNHGVGLFLLAENTDTASGSGAVLDLIAAYRAAKLSAAIRRGQERARAAGKTIGRPIIPLAVRRRIMVDLAQNPTVRPLARKYGVSPGSIVNIRRSMAATLTAAA